MVCPQICLMYSLTKLSPHTALWQPGEQVRGLALHCMGVGTARFCGLGMVAEIDHGAA